MEKTMLNHFANSQKAFYGCSPTFHDCQQVVDLSSHRRNQSTVLTTCETEALEQTTPWPNTSLWSDQFFGFLEHAAHTSSWWPPLEDHRVQRVVPAG